MKKAIYYLVVLLLVVPGLIIAAGIFLYLTNPPGSEEIPKTVYIHQGTIFAEVAKILEDEGVIKDRWKFSLLARYHQGTKRIKAGEYHLTTSMLPLDVLNVLVEGKVVEYSTTIPEGNTLYQVADLLSGAGFVDRDKFVERCFDHTFIASLGIKGDSLEGYLFPDTYKIPRDLGVKGILELMVSRFRNVYTGEYAEKAKELGFSMQEVITLASIVEKETGKSWERPMIAAVFHNRLKKGIRLQSDPTAVYDIPDFKGKIRKKHLKRNTPYNTYLNEGLPPGPIANPGEASIKAVLYPDDVKYLYFVSKKDGTHKFSNSLREHNAAIRKYLKRKNKPRATSGRP